MSNQSGIINKTAYKLWRVPAILLSYLFHPVFVPVYFMLFLLYVHPIHFLGYTSRERLLILLQAVSMFSFFSIDYRWVAQGTWIYFFDTATRTKKTVSFRWLPRVFGISGSGTFGKICQGMQWWPFNMHWVFGSPPLRL